jgi:hypothetical protein
VRLSQRYPLLLLGPSILISIGAFLCTIFVLRAAGYSVKHAWDHSVVLRSWQQIGLPTGEVLTNDSIVYGAGGFDRNGYCSNHLYFQKDPSAAREKLDCNSDAIGYGERDGAILKPPISLKNAKLFYDSDHLLTLKIDGYLFKRSRNLWFLVSGPSGS